MNLYKFTGTGADWYGCGKSVTVTSSDLAAWDAASNAITVRVSRDAYSGFAPTWETNLWDRANKPWANRNIGFLHDRMRHAKSGRAKSRVDLEMMRLSDYVRQQSLA